MWDINYGLLEILTLFVMLVFLGGIIILVVWGIKKLTNRSNATTSNHTPLDIAKERYAKGEINKEQFEQIKKDLS